MKTWLDWSASDVMSAPVTVLPQSTTLREAAAILTEGQISGAPVVNGAGTPVGVVSLFDIVTYLAGLDRPADHPGGFYGASYPPVEPEGSWGSPSEGLEAPGTREPEDAPANAPDGPEEAGGPAADPGESLRETTVDEIMTPELIAVPPETRIPEVAETLWRRRIHRIFVSKGERLLGVISTMDLMVALTARGLVKREPRTASRSHRPRATAGAHRAGHSHGSA
ncbi:MAG: CBS domain-containing protein [Planctomycetes bacterium]|nr:CBS domain-containing protein [Planctomycetota bacterium]